MLPNYPPESMYQFILYQAPSALFICVVCIQHSVLFHSFYLLQNEAQPSNSSFSSFEHSCNLVPDRNSDFLYISGS